MIIIHKNILFTYQSPSSRTVINNIITDHCCVAPPVFFINITKIRELSMELGKRYYSNSKVEIDDLFRNL